METKKISFGFSKINKKLNLLAGKNAKNEETQVELIKCLEGKEIQLVEEKNVAAPLIIPLLQNTKTSTALASLLKRRAVLLGEEEEAQKEVVDTNKNNNIEQNTKTLNGIESIEARAARELLAEAQANGSATTIENKLVLAVPKPDELPLEGAKEPTQHDYEDIPVEQFGFAMLRGMGWVEPPKDKSATAAIDDGPFVRPRGMGLGADKALKPRPLLIPPEANEKLEIKKQAYVRILGGKHKDAYGQIEGFDDDRSRVIVKMAIGGAKDSFNEFLCQPVSKKEFTEYGKCINTAKYEEYKRLENDYGVREVKYKEENRRTKIEEDFTEKKFKIEKEFKKKDNIEYERDTKMRKNYHNVENSKLQTDDRKRREDELVSRDRVDSKSEQDYRRKSSKQHIDERREHESRYSPAHYSRRQNLASVDKQSTDSSVSSDDSDSAYERRSIHKSEKSKKNKKSAKRSKSKKKSVKNDYSEDDSSEDSEELKMKKSKSHHKKKTKKSKKPRSRSRERR